MGFPYTEVSPVLRSLQSSPVSVPLYNNLWLTSLSPCVFCVMCACGQPCSSRFVCSICRVTGTGLVMVLVPTKLSITVASGD